MPPRIRALDRIALSVAGEFSFLTTCRVHLAPSLLAGRPN